MKNTNENWKERFDEKFVIKSNAGTDLLRFTDANLIKSFISQEIETAYQKGVEDEKRNPFHFRDDFIKMLNESRLQTIEEVEKMIKKLPIDFEELVDFYGTGKNIKVTKDGATYKKQVLQQLNNMKEYERHN